jgi:CHASE2 domain-containing sensor protein
MLERVAGGRPKLIFLDLDPTRPGDETGLKQLVEALARLGSGPTPILLFRTPMASAHENLPVWFRPSPELDAVVEQSPALIGVSAGVLPSDDGVVRRAPLWVAGCLGDRVSVLPSAAVAAWVILRDGVTAARERLPKALEQAGQPCTVGASLPDQPMAAPEVSVGGRNYRLANSWPGDSFNYSMSEKLEPGLRRDERALMVVSAKAFVDNPQNVAVAPDAFRDRAVIIGSSAPDLRDRHLTPLGEMPGAMVVANQLRSLLDNGPGDGRSFWFGLAVTAALCVVTFALWLLFGRLAAGAPKIVEQLYSMAIGGLLWIALTFLAGSAAALLFPLIQYFVILTLFTMDPRKSLQGLGVLAKNAR